MNNKDSSTKGFYTHEKFGLVPIGWDVVKLGDYFDFFPTASYSRALLSETGDCGYIHYGDIHTRFDRFIDAKTDTLPCISEEMVKRYTPITDGDLIISDASEDYEGVGKSVEVINIGQKVIISGLHTLHLRVKNNEFITGFKGYILNQEKVRNSILRIATGIKVYSVSKTELKKIYLPKPPEDEQIQITNILSLVDSAIQATQNSIKAAEKLKKGLMQNLLIGKLKPDGRWRTKDEFYKDEKFGNVPVGWVVARVKDFGNIQTGKTPPTAEHEVFSDNSDSENSIMFLTPGDVGITKYLSTSERHVTLKGLKYSYELPLNTVCIVCIGSTIGKIGITQTISCTNQQINSVILNENNDSEFFYYMMLYRSSHFREIAGINATPQINKSGLSKYKLLRPENKEEQIKISQKIAIVDKEIENKTNKISILHKLKKSLMQNLLTGKVRVDVEKTNQIFNEIVKAL